MKRNEMGQLILKKKFSIDVNLQSEVLKESLPNLQMDTFYSWAKLQIVKMPPY